MTDIYIDNTLHSVSYYDSYLNIYFEDKTEVHLGFNQHDLELLKRCVDKALEQLEREADDG